jgi:putative redox protein
VDLVIGWQLRPKHQSSSPVTFMIYWRGFDTGELMDKTLTKISATWKGEMTFMGQNDAGGTVQMGTMDGQPGVGPMQLLLVALAGCTGMDILSTLQKKRAKLVDLQVRVSGERASDYPMIWTAIHISYLIWGAGINSKDVEQAIELSENKYCSVGIMLGKTSKITSEYHLLKSGENIA